MKRPKYLKLAGEIEQAIRDGTLLPGARLPSVRELMTQRQVSLSTVTAALGRLEEAGLVEPRPKSGYFVKPPTHPASAGPTARRAGVDDVEIDTPAEDLYPAQRLKKLMASIVRRYPELPARPPRRAASLKLAKALARRSAEYGCFLRDTAIVLTQGDTEALSLALRACTSPGDAVLLRAPFDPSLGRVLDALELERVELPASTGLVAALERALAAGAPARVLLVNPSFHCLTGELLPVADKRELLRIAQRADLTIIEDDRLGDLQHEGARPLPVKSFDTEERVIYLNSCCRSLAPGLQIGWLAAGAPWRERIEALKSVSSSNVSELSQLVLAEFLGRGSHLPHLRKLRERLKARSETVLDVLRDRLGAEARVTGGYAIWLAALEAPGEAETFVWAKRWPELFAGAAPVLGFVAGGLYVNASRDLSDAQQAALAECCEAIAPHFSNAARRAAPGPSESVSPN